MEHMEQPRMGLLETISLRLGFIGYIAAVVGIVREWGNWSFVWKAVAAVAAISPLGIALGGIVTLPIALLIGRLAPMESPGRLGHNLVSIIPVLGIMWACVLCAQSFNWL